MKTLNGTSNPNEFKAYSENGTIADPTEAIFPIIKQDMCSGSFSFVGTGFFVSWQGLIITAKHVLRDVISKERVNSPIGICQFLPNDEYILRNIKKGFWFDKSDVAVAVLDQPTHKTSKELLKNKVLKISLEKCAQGDPVFTFAYPDSEISENEKKQTMEFAHAFFAGELQEEYPEGRDQGMLPNPCWRCNIHIHKGASGGPVFNASGKVIGINSTSFSNDPSCSFVSTLSHIIDLKIRDIKIEGYKKNDFTLKELSEIGMVHIC